MTLSLPVTILSGSSISNSVIQLFLQTVFAWSTNLCSYTQNIPFCSHKLSIRCLYFSNLRLHNDLILLASPLSSLTNDRILMMTTTIPLSRRPAEWGYLVWKSRPIFVVSFYPITRLNSLIITEGWVIYNIYIEESCVACKDAVMQIEEALINNRFRAQKLPEICHSN